MIKNASLSIYLFIYLFDNSIKETGECKGFAFVEFYTMEHAQYFMATYGMFLF